MLYEVCYRALSSIFVVEATHGRVARGAGRWGRACTPAAGWALAAARALILSTSHRSKQIFRLAASPLPLRLA